MLPEKLIKMELYREDKISKTTF